MSDIQKSSQKNAHVKAVPANKDASVRRHPLAVSAINTLTDYTAIKIESHEELAASFAQVAQRFTENLELSTLLLINPVLAFKEINVNVSSKISRHILHTLQHPPVLAQRQTTLVRILKESWHELAQPNNPEWVSELLFTKLKLRPLDTSGHSPAYKPAINSKDILALQALRPQPRKKNKVAVKRQGTFRIRIKQRETTLRRMDFEASPAELPYTDEIPSEVTLEELFFYTNQHPLLKNLLELGIITRRSFPFHSGDSYRKIKNGEKPNAFRAWIRSVKFTNTAPS